MLTQNSDTAIQNHRAFGHKVVELANEFNGQPEHKCETCNVMLAWQVPDMQVSSEKSMELHVGWAMRLGLDGDSIDYLLLQGGFETVTDDNFDAAVRYVRDNSRGGCTAEIGWW